MGNHIGLSQSTSYKCSTVLVIPATGLSHVCGKDKNYFSGIYSLYQQSVCCASTTKIHVSGKYSRYQQSVCLCRYHKIPSGYVSPCAYAFENHIFAYRYTHEVRHPHGHACFTLAYRPAGRMLATKQQLGHRTENACVEHHVRPGFVCTNASMHLTWSSTGGPNRTPSVAHVYHLH